VFVAPGTAPDLGHKLTREAAQQVAGNWYMLLINGALLIVAGVLVFSIHWTISSLSTFIGVLFIMQGVATGLTQGIGSRTNGTNLVAGLLSIAAGIAIIAWPSPGLVAVAVFLGSFLIVSGTLAISGSIAARGVLPDWWLVLVLGLLEVPLGVLALANPGATLAALITVAGIWAVAIGVTRIALALELKRLPQDVDRAWAAPTHSTAAGNGAGGPQRAGAAHG
jgi:uncharacterized membrane protein HdeD (DUF308 family)